MLASAWAIFDFAFACSNLKLGLKGVELRLEERETKVALSLEIDLAS